MEEDGQKSALSLFFEKYRDMQKRYHLRMHGHMQIKGKCYLHIWRDVPGEGETQIIRIELESESADDGVEEAIYQRAASDLEFYERMTKK